MTHSEPNIGESVNEITERLRQIETSDTVEDERNETGQSCLVQSSEADLEVRETPDEGESEVREEPCLESDNPEIEDTPEEGESEVNEKLRREQSSKNEDDQEIKDTSEDGSEEIEESYLERSSENEENQEVKDSEEVDGSDVKQEPRSAEVDHKSLETSQVLTEEVEEEEEEFSPFRLRSLVDVPDFGYYGADGCFQAEFM